MLSSKLCWYVPESRYSFVWYGIIGGGEGWWQQGEPEGGQGQGGGRGGGIGAEKADKNRQSSDLLCMHPVRV